jgi:hypothetical protein
MNNGLFCCKGKRLANYLLEHDCRLVRIDCDQKSDGFLVFIFEKGQNLQDSLQTWKVDKETYLV